MHVFKEDRPISTTASETKLPRAGGGLRRGAMVALVLNVSSVGVLYITRIFLARWMGSTEEFGAYIYAFNWAQMLGFIASLGLPTAAVYFVPRYLEHQDLARLHGFLRSSWLISFFGGVILAAAGTVLTYIFAPNDLRASLLIGLWISPILAIVNFQKEAARGARHMALSLAPSQVLYPAMLLGGAGLIWAMTGTLGHLQTMMLLGVAACIVLVIQWVGLNRIVPPSQGVKRVFELKTWLALAIPLFFEQESRTVLRQTDVVMIQFFLGDTAEVGQYSAALQTALLGRFALLTLNTVAAPHIAGLYARGDYASLQRMVLTATRRIFWPSVALTLAACLLAKPLLGLFGKDYHGATTVLWILAIGQLIGASFGPVGHLLNLTGHHGKNLRVFSVTAVVNLALNAILIPLAGIEGAALAAGMSILMRNLWSYLLVRKHLNIHSFAFFGREKA